MNRNMRLITPEGLTLIDMLVRHPFALPCLISPVRPMRAESVHAVVRRGLRKPPYQLFQNRLDSPGVAGGEHVAQDACACADAAVPEDGMRTLKSGPLMQVARSVLPEHIRELQGLSQNALSERTGIPQSTISAIETDRVNLGVERAKVIARALRCHPAVLVFPGWDVNEESAA